MGSGAFLVAACRFLAAAYEAALISEGGVAEGDVSESERAGFRRVIAQRCLFGVDINPMAVQLGRLSLWLATLSADRPLTFLDHHLRTGNSLSGASLADVARQAPARRGARARSARLPLFELDAAADALGAAVVARESLATESRGYCRTGESEGAADGVSGTRRCAACSIQASGGPVVRRLVRRYAPVRQASAQCDIWRAARRGARPRNGAAAACVGTTASKRRQDCRTRTVLSLDPGIPRGVSRGARRAPAVGRFRCNRVQSSVGNAPRRTCRARRRRPDGLRARVGHLWIAGRRARQPVSALSRTRPDAGPAWRPGRIRPALGIRLGPWLRRAPPRTSFSALASTRSCRSRTATGLFPIHRALKFLLVTATADGSSPALARRFGSDRRTFSTTSPMSASTPWRCRSR